MSTKLIIMKLVLYYHILTLNHLNFNSQVNFRKIVFNSASHASSSLQVSEKSVKNDLIKNFFYF